MSKNINIKIAFFATTPVIMKKDVQIKCFDSAGPGLTQTDVIIISSSSSKRS